MLTLGLKGETTTIVTTENTAIAMGSGEAVVFATPAMLALMEKTAYLSVKNELEPGCSTVGTMVSISHVSASPVGAQIRCESELVEIDGKRLVFQVACYDNAGLIGKGSHERFIVQAEKFQKKADGKLA